MCVSQPHTHNCGHSCMRASCPHVHFGGDTEATLLFPCDTCEFESRHHCQTALDRRDRLQTFGHALMSEINEVLDLVPQIHALEQQQIDDLENVARLIPVAIYNITDTAQGAEHLLRERLHDAQLYCNDPNTPGRTCYAEDEFESVELCRLLYPGPPDNCRSLAPQGDEYDPEKIVAAWRNTCSIEWCKWRMDDEYEQMQMLRAAGSLLQIAADNAPQDLHTDDIQAQMSRLDLAESRRRQAVSAPSGVTRHGIHHDNAQEDLRTQMDGLQLQESEEEEL